MFFPKQQFRNNNGTIETLVAWRLYDIMISTLVIVTVSVILTLKAILLNIAAPLLSFCLSLVQHLLQSVALAKPLAEDKELAVDGALRLTISHDEILAPGCSRQILTTKLRKY